MESQRQGSKKIEFVGIMFKFKKCGNTNKNQNVQRKSALFGFGSGLTIMRILLWSVKNCLVGYRCKGYYFVCKLSYIDEMINIFQYNNFLNAYRETLEKAIDHRYLHKVFLIKTEVIKNRYFKIILIDGGVYLILEGEIIDPSIFKPEPLNWMILPSSNEIKIKHAVIARYHYLKNRKYVDLANKYKNNPTLIFLIILIWLDLDFDVALLKRIDPDLVDILKY